MGIVIGIDLSLTATACVAFDVHGESDEPKEKVLIAGGKKRGIERVVHIEREIGRFVFNWKPELVCLESYAYSRINQAHQCGELGGVIRRRLYLDSVKWIAISPMTVKKFSTGRGNSDKNVVMLCTYKKWGQTFLNDNEADAYVLARIGAILAGRNDILTAYQINAMAAPTVSYKEVLMP